MVRLGDICRFQSGGTPNKNNANFYNGTIPWITTVALNGNTIGEESAVEWITDEAIQESSAKVVPKNSIMVGTRVGIGKVAINSVPMSTSQDIISLVGIDESIWDELFLCKFILSKNDFLISQSRGATIKGIRIDTLSNLIIPDILIDEQRKIAAVLDKVSDLMAKRRQQMNKLDELVKSRFIELFGDPEQNPMAWNKQPLSKIIINANNGMARRGNDPHGNIVMRLVELQDGHIDYTAPNRIELTDTEKRRYLLRESDFLFARVNGNPEYVGRCAAFHEIGEPVYHNDHIIRVHFDDAVMNGAFASALINSAYGKRQMRGQIKTSAGQYTISQEGIGAIIAILPPIDLQEQFAAFVEQTDKSKLFGETEVAA